MLGIRFDWKMTLIIVAIAIILMAIVVVVLFRPGPVEAPSLWENPEKISETFPVLTIQTSGQCQFDQLIKAEFMNNATIKCDYMNGTLASPSDTYYFEGEIIKATYTGTLKGKSQDNLFVGDLKGTLEDASIVGNAAKKIVAEPSQTPQLKDLIPSWAIGLTILIIVAAIGGYLYYERNIKKIEPPYKRWNREEFVEKAREYMEKAGFTALPDEGGFQIVDGEIPTQTFRIADPPHLRGRVYEVYETPQGMQHRQATENTIQSLKEAPRSFTYSRAMEEEIRRQLEWRKRDKDKRRK